jgi:chromosome segregation ATPase
MTNGDDRMTALERRLDAMGEDVRELKEDVRELKDDVRVLKDDVRELKDDVRELKDDVWELKDDVRGLKDDVRGLRVLYEHHDDQIRTIAEVQAHQGRLLENHGQLLREIKHELGPLRDLHDFVRRVAENHESRITRLENHAGL